MCRTVRLMLLLVVFSASGIGGPLTTAARAQPDASPEPTFPVTPDSADCTVEPRAPESLAALLGPPVAAGAPVAPARFPEPFVAEVPVGRPVEEEIREQVIATVVESSACFNAGDSLRGFALVTDAFLQGYVEANAVTADQIVMLLAVAEPVPPELRETVLAVTDVTTLPDGRAGAFVVTNSEWRGPDTIYMLLAQQGERWLIDEIIGFLAA